MLLDRRSRVLENLDTIKTSYLKLTLLKEREIEAQDESNYEFLYELSENERILIEGINDCLKCIVPDLLALREDASIRALLAEIDDLHGTVISDSIRIRRDLRRRMTETEEKLRRLSVFPKSTLTPPPHILDIRG